MRSWFYIAAVGLTALAACSRAAEHSDRTGAHADQQTAPPPVWVFYDPARTSAERVATAITRMNGRVRYQSRWLHAVSASVDPDRIRRTRGVLRVQPVGQLVPATPAGGTARHMAALTAAFDLQQQTDSVRYGPNYSALRELGVPQAHALGFRGELIRIALIDTGFETAHQAFDSARIAGRIVAQRDFINNDANVTTQPGDPPAIRDPEIHGTWVWSILGANLPGQMIGPASRAEFVLAKVGIERTPQNPDAAADEDRWVAAVEWADSAGRARVINSSLVFKNFQNKPSYVWEMLDGDIAVSTRMADEAARRGILLVTPIGNTPTPATSNTLFAPADADSALAVGAIDALDQVWAFSARGPTADVRTKPDLVARGVDVYAANSTGSPAFGNAPAGTSLASPFIAGGAALFMQAWPSLTANAAREALIRSGSSALQPDISRGAGRPNVAAAIMLPNGIQRLTVQTLDGNRQLTTITPRFNWDTGPVHPLAKPVYRVQLASDPNFNTVFYSDTTSADFLLLKQPLRPTAGSFWWRVIAELGTPNISRSSPVDFPLSMPHWVRLTPMPPFVNTTQPQFNWTSLTAPLPGGPLAFDLRILHANGQVAQTLRNANPGDALVELLTANLSYRWQVIARALGSNPAMADTVTSTETFVVTSSEHPPTTSLYPSFPNPFPRNGEEVTRFWFDLAQGSRVELTIHDLRGRLVRRLIPAGSGCTGQMLPGQYGRGVVEQSDPCTLLAWDGRNQSGQRVARGVYFARLRANGTVSTQRILFLPER